MKTTTLFSSLSICLIVSACQVTAPDEHQVLQGLANHSVKTFVANQNGCNKLDNTKVIKMLPAEKQQSANDPQLHREHWRVNACGKTHELELSIDKKQHTVVVQAME